MAGVPGLDAGECVLEDGGLRRRDPHGSGALEERVGRRLAAQAAPLRHHAVDALVEEVDDSRRDQDVPAVGAGGDHRRPEPGVADGVDVAHRSRVRLDAALADELEHAPVLAGAEPGDRLGGGRVGGGALGERDAARRQEVADPVGARLAVDVGVVVVPRVERDERVAGAARALQQVGVEHRLPRGGVDHGRPGQDAVQVEEAGAGPDGKSEHEPSVPRSADPAPLGGGPAVLQTTPQQGEHGELLGAVATGRARHPRLHLADDRRDGGPVQEVVDHAWVDVAGA